MNADFEVREVELSGVGKRYGNRVVLDPLNLSIAKGEFVTLIGPSGCGKSTVLKMMAGLTSPNGGAIRVDGMTPKNARKTISFIFQDATLLPWRTVRQNVGLGLELEGALTSRREEKTATFLELNSGIEPGVRRLSARPVRWDENACLYRASPGHKSSLAVDGRTFRGIG